MCIIDHDDVGAETGDRRKRHCPAITAGEIVELRNLRVVEPNPVAPPPLIPVRFDEHGETERASPAWRPGDWRRSAWRWETITFVAALRHNKMVAPMVVEGAMTGEMFLAYVENCLLPMLRRNDIVVMDNCRVHLGTGIRRAIETVGATLRYLPNIRPTAIPSRCLTANSRHSCVKWQREPSQALTAPSAPSSRSSVLKNAPTISGMQATFQYDRNPL